MAPPVKTVDLKRMQSSNATIHRNFMDVMGKAGKPPQDSAQRWFMTRLRYSLEASLCVACCARMCPCNAEHYLFALIKRYCARAEGLAGPKANLSTKAPITRAVYPEGSICTSSNAHLIGILSETSYGLFRFSSRPSSPYFSYSSFLLPFRFLSTSYYSSASPPSSPSFLCVDRSLWEPNSGLRQTIVGNQTLCFD